MMPEVRSHRLGASLRLAVRPGAGKTRLLGEHGGALKLAVAAAADRGRANREALSFLAEALGLSFGDLELMSGERSRNKTLLCRGLSAEELRRRLSSLLPV